MFTAIKAEKVHTSMIVATLNRRRQDYAIYDKYKRTIDEVEVELDSWRVILSGTNTVAAFIKIHNTDWVSRVLRYSLILASDIPHRDLLRRAISDLFETYNVAKLTTDIIYDRNDVIKDHIFFGGNIEVRKRQHLFSDGKYSHVVEMAIFSNEFRNE